MASKLRVLIWFIILGVLAYLSLGYSFEMYMLVREFKAVGTVTNFIVDGLDLTPLISMFVGGASAILFALFGLIYVGVIFAVNLILLLLFRFMGLGRNKVVCSHEKYIYKVSFKIFSIALFCIGFGVVRFRNPFSVLIFNGITVLCIWLIVVNKLKEK